MKLKLLCLVIAAVFVVGCGQPYPGTISTPYPPHTYNPLVTDIPPGSNPNPAFDPLQIDKAALPAVSDLPTTPVTDRGGPARKYTGIIKNNTRYDVQVPAGASGGTLFIPARGWTEYVSYARHFNLTAYHNGKPFYCMNINATPRNFAFMCDRYDFMVEISKPEPTPRPSHYKKMKRYHRKADLKEVG